MKNLPADSALARRHFLAAGVGVALTPVALARHRGPRSEEPAKDRPTMIGSANALAAMKNVRESFRAGGDPLDAVIEVVKIPEANADDLSVGLGGLPDESGHVTLDAACMHGPTHNSGAVGCLQNIMHASEVARLVMERTDHCLLVGEGAYRFARDHGHPHAELLTDRARRIWTAWRERMSEGDDRLAPAKKDQKSGMLFDVHGEQVTLEEIIGDKRPTGTIHCSALSLTGEYSSATTTSGLAYKVPGRVGDSPIVGAGLYCDQEAGAAGATGRGESAILSNSSFAMVELMRQGASPEEAGLEVLRRVTRQAQRAAAWQPEMVDDQGRPSFGLHLYAMGLDGATAGVSLRGGGRYAVADLEKGPRHEELVALHP
ncbi:MAG: isoaspartyl peptidase/L-asparaginase [bacterium]